MRHILVFTLVAFLMVAMTACAQPSGGLEITSEPSVTDEAIGESTPPTISFVQGLPAEMVTAQPIPLPIGIASDTHDGIGLMFFGRDGIVEGELRRPPQAWFSRGFVHFAGVFDRSFNFPLVYFQGEFEGDCQECGLWVLTGEQTSRLVELREMEALIGVPAVPVMAYVERQYDLESGLLRSLLYAGELEALPTAQPVMVLESSESRFLKPVAIRMENGSIAGVWYTQLPYGIGGEIVFEPTEGLYYLDLSTNTSYEVLPAGSQFSDLSVSQTWITYTEYAVSGSHDLVVRNLTSGQSLNFQRLPESDHGTGSALISPDNYYVAWLEVSGSLMDESYHSTIRVATLEGLLIADFPQENFYKAAGLGTELIVLRPIGWMDEASILVSVVNPTEVEQAAVVLINLQTGNINFLAPGTFVGFTYP